MKAGPVTASAFIVHEIRNKSAFNELRIAPTKLKLSMIIKICDIICPSSQASGGAFCYVHLLLTGSDPLTYLNYIFTEFDKRRIK
jgi:hypothetical protein